MLKKYIDEVVVNYVFFINFIKYFFNFRFFLSVKLVPKKVEIFLSTKNTYSLLVNDIIDVLLSMIGYVFVSYMDVFLSVT